jgi:hypothetical protein
MEQPSQSKSESSSESAESEMDDPLIDRERSKGLPKGMFIGKDGVVYGLDEEENDRQLKELAETIDHQKLLALAKKMESKRAKLEESDPDF